MPRIRGTNEGDSIDVSNNGGTLNGAAQGTPINGIRGRRGDDAIAIRNSTIEGNIRGGSGNDTIALTNSAITSVGVLNAGADDDTVIIEGSNVVETRLGDGSDTLNFVNSTASGDLLGDDGTDVLNLPPGTIVNDDANTAPFTVGAVGSTYVLTSGSFTLPTGQTVNYSSFDNGTSIPCFANGTRIETDRGRVLIENLKPGDMAATHDAGLQAIQWIGTRKLSARELEANPKLLPIRIMAGSLGQGLPLRDLLVSRQHRMLVTSKIAQRMFGSSVLIPAIKLTGLPGIFVDTACRSIEYFHMLFERHELVFAEGAPTESFFTGPEALKSMSSEALEEIIALFPELVEQTYAPQPVRYIPSGKQQKRLIARHIKNGKHPI